MHCERRVDQSRYIGRLMTIRLATRTDIPAIMELEARYYVGNLDDSARKEGFISILHTREWLEATVDDGGIHVADAQDGTVLGFIVVSPPPQPHATGVSALMRAMTDMAQTISFGGRPITQQRYAVRGPVLIDRSARGQGLYSAFNAVTREAYRDRYDLGVLFVSADNPRSLHTTSTKLGAEDLGTFEVDSRQYHFMAFAY